MKRPGADLALLLLGGFRTMADHTTAELAERGYDYRATHDFALRAIESGADSASELGRRLSVTKQAAAKTIAALEDRRYVVRSPDPTDRRRTRITVTERGSNVMSEGEAILNDLRERWAAQIGADRLAEVEAALRRLVGDVALMHDTPGWVAQDLD